MSNIDQFLNQEFLQTDSPLFSDLKTNFHKIMTDLVLDKKVILINLVALARVLFWHELESFCILQLKQLSLAENEINECFEVAAVMSMNNAYYKFKSALPTEVSLDPAYERIGLRNLSLKQTSIGQYLTESIAFTVSVLNGCTSCIVAHEKTLTQLGVTRNCIHELAKLTAVVKGLSIIKK